MEEGHPRARERELQPRYKLLPPPPPPLTVTLGSKGRYVSAWVEKCGIHSDEDGQGCRAAAGPMTQCSAQGTAGHATAFLV